MVKIRKIASIEKGIEEVIKILNEDEIHDAIGKGASYLRKCGDPDLNQKLHHSDAVKLDLKCIAKGKSPPLLNSHKYILDEGSGDIKPESFIASSAAIKPKIINLSIFL